MDISTYGQEEHIFANKRQWMIATWLEEWCNNCCWLLGVLEFISWCLPRGQTDNSNEESKTEGKEFHFCLVHLIKSWWSPSCQKKWRSSPTPPRSPWQQPQDVGKHIHVVHLECGVATAHIFIADFWTFHRKSNRYFLSLSLPAANWGERRLPKFHFHFSFHFTNVFIWDGTSVPVGPQYLNCRPGVSVIEM